MQNFESLIEAFASFVWGMPLVVLLLGGGSFLLLYSRFKPYTLLPHALELLRGKFPEATAQGQLSHAQALSAALAGTIGLGNIAGVAVAVKIGGPGAIFWMWMTAVVGVATKFFTGTLAVMYRGTDRDGQLRGGPMYVVTEGLGQKFKPLAALFCIAGLIGCLPALQINQVVETTQTLVLAPLGLTQEYDPRWFSMAIGAVSAFAVGAVVFGGLSRIAGLSIRVVPLMCAVYLIAVAGILLQNIGEIPSAFASIFAQAFTPDAAFGGALVAVLLIGVRRGLFSNEAGIGTEVLAHSTAKTNEPVREGLVAMLGPIIDTLLVCTATALAIMVTDVAQTTDLTGASLTSAAFYSGYGAIGQWLLYGLVLVFAFTTMTSYSFYGSECAAWLGGKKAEQSYRVFYVASIVFVALLPLSSVLNLIDGMYALMAIPTMVSTLILAPKVLEALERYRCKQGLN